jgi:hypothetical protein
LRQALLQLLSVAELPKEAPLQGLPFLYLHPSSLQSPQVLMLAWQTHETCHFFWTIQEDPIRTEVKNHNGPVWTDSCIELFFKTEHHSPHYFNIEVSASGALLIQTGVDRHNRIPLDPQLVCVKTLIEPYQKSWSCLLQLPAKHWAPPIVGNSYKCADQSPRPHWLSLFAVPTQRPDFHRPEFFDFFSYC